MAAAADAHAHGHGDANLHPPPIHFSSRIAPPIVRFVERRVGVTQYLQMHTAHTP